MKPPCTKSGKALCSSQGDYVPDYIHSGGRSQYVECAFCSGPGRSEL